MSWVSVRPASKVDKAILPPNWFVESEGIYQRRSIGYVAFCTSTHSWCDVGQVTMLPNVALLRIFDFYVGGLPIEA